MLSVGNIYSLSTVAPGILGARLERAKLSGIIDYNTANSFINVESIQRAVYSILPTGTPVSPKSYSFFIFTLENGETKVLAKEWMDESSIELIETVTITVKLIANNASEVTKIREALSLLGHKNFTIEVS
jgi:hypothetical protein